MVNNYLEIVAKAKKAIAEEKNACACRGVGCWELKAGETIAFAEH